MSKPTHPLTGCGFANSGFRMPHAVPESATSSKSESTKERILQHERRSAAFNPLSAVCHGYVPPSFDPMNAMPTVVELLDEQIDPLEPNELSGSSVTTEKRTDSEATVACGTRQSIDWSNEAMQTRAEIACHFNRRRGRIHKLLLLVVALAAIICFGCVVASFFAHLKTDDIPIKDLLAYNLYIAARLCLIVSCIVAFSCAALRLVECRSQSTVTQPTELREKWDPHTFH